MKNNWLRMGYVMVSRALLMDICEKQGKASSDEDAFLRVLVHANYQNAVTRCNGVEVTCARGESVISFVGWADILGWKRGRVRRFFERCFAEGILEKVSGPCASHIRVPNYDAWTGNPAGKKTGERRVDEALVQFVAKYSEVTHLPIENKGKVGKAWKTLSSRERKLALERIEDYYYSLDNVKFCLRAAGYLENKAFENEM